MKKIPYSDKIKRDMQNKNLNRIITTALRDLEPAVPDIKQMIRDLKIMRLTFRNRGGDIDQLLRDKKLLIRQMWKLGKIPELLQNGLINSDGTLTKEAFKYLEQQRQGKISSGFFPGEVLIEFSIINLDKAKKEKKH